MAIIYEEVTPSPIENVVVKKAIVNGVHRQYNLEAVDGYVLHDNRGCWAEIDPITGEEIMKHAFYCGICSCIASYDFAANPYEFYAVPETQAPSDQIFGGVTNKPEVM